MAHFRNNWYNGLVLELFEDFRSKDPVIYNIETTNACNMTCKMCPRTTKMTREITYLEHPFYENIIKQIKPHSKELWEKWEEFCTKTYGIKPDDGPSENHFFLYIIPKVIQLHGYGDPLLDKNLGIESGALGGKLTGAGGGGHLLFYCESSKQKNLVEKIQSKGLKQVQYKFYESGCKVLDLYDFTNS